MEKISVIGLGLMGSGVASHLCQIGTEAAVFDRNPDKSAAFNGRAQVCGSALEAAEASDAILLSLPDSNAVEAVVGELLEGGLRDRVIIDLSTSFPESTKALHKKCKEAGIEFLDCPLLAGPDEAASGELTALVGGDPDVVERMDGVIRSFCKSYDYAGPSGSGHTAKLMMNFTGLMYVVILAQMFPLAEKAGLDPMKLYHMMDTDLFSTWMYRFYGPKMINSTFDMAFQLKLGMKDLSYVKRMYDLYQVPAFALDGGLEMLQRAVDENLGDMDFSRCAQVMQELLGLSGGGQ